MSKVGNLTLVATVLFLVSLGVGSVRVTRPDSVMVLDCGAPLSVVRHVLRSIDGPSDSYVDCTDQEYEPRRTIAIAGLSTTGLALLASGVLYVRRRRRPAVENALE